MKHPVLAVILATFLLLFLSGCFGPVNPVLPDYTVSGTVIDGEGAGIENVMVRADDGRFTYTNSDGHWRLIGLRGTRRITAILDDWVFTPNDAEVSKETHGITFIGKPGFTPFKGLIETDVRWTVDDSPVKVVGDIRIAEGARLTVEPGVRVYSGNPRAGQQPKIEVAGELLLSGQPEAPVLLEDLRVQWFGFHGLIMADHSVIHGGYFAASDGSLSSGQLTLRNSQLVDVMNAVAVRHAPRPTYIEKNVFIRSPGISVFMIGGKATEWPHDAKVYIRNNVFYEQPTSYGPAVRLDLSYVGDVVLRYNSFLSTDRVALYSTTAADARENFWNTLFEEEIEAMINDRFPGTGGTQYKPFLTAPHPDTPELPTVVPAPRYNW